MQTPWKTAALLCLLAILFPWNKSAVNANTSDRHSGVLLTTYTETYQQAFTMLVPAGWRAEGGMIPSGVPWNVVDLVENNIRFRVTSPDGKSFFGWYPRFYFQDPQVFVRSSGGMLHPQVGQVMNGCWIYPYMGVAEYVQHIVFNRFAINEFQNPRILGPAVKSPELEAFIPRMATRKDCGYVNFECTIGTTPMQGRMYTINYELQGVIWSTVGTFGILAPATRWKMDERIMEICIRSFRLNPRWVQQASAASRQRAQQYHQVIQDIQRIDNEISANRTRTHSDMQEEFYKVITDQIETWDPETGSRRYLPSYNHAYTDGRGNYFLRDNDDGTLPFDNAPEWRELKVIHRNDPAYRSD